MQAGNTIVVRAAVVHVCILPCCGAIAAAAWTRKLQVTCVLYVASQVKAGRENGKLVNNNDVSEVLSAALIAAE